MKFKNARHPSRLQKPGIDVSPPPEKRQDWTRVMLKMNRHVEYLQLYTSKKASITSICTILEQTAQLRRKWIFGESPPSIKEIMEKFPWFNDPRIVSSKNISYYAMYMILQYM